MTDLLRLAERLRACRLCRDNPAGGMARQLPHEPRPVAVFSNTAPVLIASQAPGMRVHQTGLPFNDASGDRLRDWLGVSREAFYDPARFAIVPMGFCFPGYDATGGDLPPRRECAPAWREEIISSLPNIQLILTIGGYAQKWHFARAGLVSGGVNENVRNWRALLDPPEGPPLFALPHPSWRNTGWLRKNPWFEDEVLPELRARVSTLLL